MTHWPETVPVLTAENMHQGGSDGPNGTHCLWGWLEECFEGFLDAKESIETTIRDECQLRHGHRLASIANDELQKQEPADMWNAAIGKCGYIRQGSVFVRQAAEH